MAAHQPPDQLLDFSIESGQPPLSLRIISRLVMLVSRLLHRKPGTLDRRLSDLLELKTPAQLIPVAGVSSKDVVINKETGVWVRLYTPCGTSSGSFDVSSTSFGSLPIVFYFHGGGFALLCANNSLYDSFCKELCRKCQTVVISVDYRKSPEHRYPIAYDDCFSALQWLQTQGQAHIPSNADLSRCFLMGDSAGGNIVHHVGCRAAAEDLRPVRIVGNMLLFPFFGGEERTPSELRLLDAPMVNIKHADWFWAAYLPEGANRDHPAANVFGPNAPDISNLPLPPSLVVVGEYDSLKDWQIRYVDSLRKIGKEVQLLYYKGGIHCFHMFSGSKLASQFLRDVEEFMKARCGFGTEARYSTINGNTSSLNHLCAL